MPCDRFEEGVPKEAKMYIGSGFLCLYIGRKVEKSARNTEKNGGYVRIDV